MQTSRAAFLVLATLLASAPLIRGDLRAQARSIDDFFSSFTAEWVRLNPNQATASRYFTGPEQDALETQLTPATREWRHRRVELARRGVAELAAFERSRLSDTQRVSADLMTWQLAIVVEGEKYEDFTFPLEQFGGVNVSLPTQLTVVHPLITEKDAANYLARLGHVATRMEEATAEAVAPEKRGWYRRASSLARPLRRWSSSFPHRRRRIRSSRYSTIGWPRRAAFDRHQGEAACPGGANHFSQIYPAWRNALAALRPLQGESTDVAGLSRFAGGAEAYAYHLRRFTSTNLTPEEIHRIGLREVSRIEGEMDAILKRLGRTEGSVRGSHRTARE